MKVGDLVKLKSMNRKSHARVGLIVDLVEKKCWRTHTQGNRVNWGAIEPEPHAVVSIKGRTLTIPIIDLSPVNEVR